MSTSAVISPNTSAALPVKNENVTFLVVVKLDENSKIKSVRHTSNEKDITALQAPDYKGDETVAFSQVVVKPSVGTLEGFETLIPDADVRLDIINKGIAAKFNQKIRTSLIELDEAGNLVFQPTDTPYDATALVQEAALRTVQSPMDKALKAIAGLTPDMQAAILAALQASAAVQ